MSSKLPRITNPFSSSDDEGCGDKPRRSTKLPRIDAATIAPQSLGPEALIPSTRLPRSNVTLGQAANEATAGLNDQTQQTGTKEPVKEKQTLVLSNDTETLGDLQTLLANKHGAICSRAKELCELIVNDTSAMALKPSNPLQMEETVRVVLALQANSYAARTMAQDNGSN